MDQVTIEELVINTFLLLRTKKKCVEHIKIGVISFQGLEDEFIKKKKKNPNQTKARRVEELII